MYIKMDRATDSKHKQISDLAEKKARVDELKKKRVEESKKGTNAEEGPEEEKCVSTEKPTKTETKTKTYRINFNIKDQDPDYVISEIAQRGKYFYNSEADLESEECYKHLEYFRNVVTYTASTETTTSKKEECAVDETMKEVVSTVKTVKEKKTMYADKLADENMPEIFRKIWLKYFTDKVKLEDVHYKKYLYPSLVAIWNGTDRSLKMCHKCLSTLLYLDILCFLRSAPIKPETMLAAETNESHIVRGLTGILHNLVRTVEIRQELREGGAVDIMRSYLSSANLMIQCKAEIILAYILNEEESAVFNSDPKHVEFILTILRSALKHPEHRSRYGFSALETVKALNKLAVNDFNKQLIANSGGIPLYEQLLESNTPTEQEVAAYGLWLLAFTCSKQIHESPGCLDSKH